MGSCQVVRTRSEIEKLKQDMREAAENLEFERAIAIRDELFKLTQK
jgi:excinuclease UvrABC helicase subunit UvrB